MTDRELLEAAAKAAGIDAEFHPELGYGPEGMWLKGERSPDNSKYWNPLVNDGDSAWLRRSCRLVVQWFPTDVAAMHFGSDGRGRSWAEPYGDDPAAAERRAVVRAAAAIGAQMP